MRPPRAAWRVALALSLVAGVAFAQAPAVKKPRPAPLPPPVAADDAASADNTLGNGSVMAPPLRGPLGTGSTPPAPVLRSAVHSRWSTPATIATRGGGACRAQCATARIACLAPVSDDEAPRCNAAWTGCLSTCGTLAYGRAPVTPQ